MNMKSEAEQLREDLRDLAEAHNRGDVPERGFGRKLEKLSVDLSRAVIRGILREGEEIREEHHVVRNHLALNQSVLRDQTQEAISLFLTDVRLFCLAIPFDPAKPIVCDETDGTSLRIVELSDVSNIRTKREIRTGEAIAGAIIAVAAILFHDWLSVTGSMMAGLGILGVAHGMLLPTRWIEIEAQDLDPIHIHATGKKSARRLISRLRENLAVPVSPSQAQSQF